MNIYPFLTPDIYNYPEYYKINYHNPIFIPKKHTIQSYAAQNRAAKKRKK